MKQSARQPILANYILIPSCELWLSTTQEMCNEVCFTANVYVPFVWTAPQAFIKCSTVALLFAAIKFTNKDVVCSEDFIFAISAKPVEKKNFKIKNQLHNYFMKLVNSVLDNDTPLPCGALKKKKSSRHTFKTYTYKRNTNLGITVQLDLHLQINDS